jgi:hypothetical protein
VLVWEVRAAGEQLLAQRAGGLPGLHEAAAAQLRRHVADEVLERAGRVQRVKGGARISARSS